MAKRFLIRNNFYSNNKVLLESGFKEDVDKWIDEFIKNTELLEGIYLDLVCCYSDLNEAISCLHNYIGCLIQMNQLTALLQIR